MISSQILVSDHNKVPPSFNRVFSHDVTAAILVSQNNETAAMLVSQTSPLGVEFLSYANAFFCSNKFAYMLATWVKTLYRRLTGYTCTSLFRRESKHVFRVFSICVRLSQQVSKYEHRLLSIMQMAFYAILHLLLGIFHFNGYALPTIKPNLRDRPL